MLKLNLNFMINSPNCWLFFFTNWTS